MDDDAVWLAIDAERLRLADLLDQLTDAEWRTASLCEGWTIRDVAAHLTLQGLGLGDALRMLVRHPGSMNRMILESSRRKAAAPVEQLIGEIRALAGSRRPNLGLSNREALIDVLVHGQDIALPLRRELPMPPEPAVLAAATVWSFLGTFKGRVFRRVPWQGFRFVATDVDWSVGSGDEITGSIGALLLLLTGRTVALTQLAGPGADRLRETLVETGQVGRS